MRTALVSAVAALLLAGCAGLAREAVPTVWIALEIPPAGGGLRAGGPSLEVGRFATAETFATDRLVGREGSGQWAFASRHRWVAEPGWMVSAHLRESLSGSGLFAAVFTPPSPVDADYRLRGAVRSLFWDREVATAVLEVEASLVNKQGQLIGFWVHRAAEPVRGAEVDAFLAAAAAAEARVLGMVRGDLATALAGIEPSEPAPASR